MTTTDLVPAENMAALAAMEPATREVAVTRMLGQAQQWLAHAVESCAPITEIADFKKWAVTVEEATKQLGFSKAIQLDATEMVRRGERGIGVAIRRGQESGEVRRQHEGGGPKSDYVRLGKTVHPTATHGERVPDAISPRTFFTNMQQVSETYAMTDGVSDEQFDQAITEARAEGNLARANVIRKVRGETTSSSSPRPEVLRKTRRLDSNRIVEQTVLAVDGIDSLLDQVDFAELDGDSLPHWIDALATATASLRRLRNNLDKELKARV